MKRPICCKFLYGTDILVLFYALLLSAQSEQEQDVATIAVTAAAQPSETDAAIPVVQVFIVCHT